MSFPEKPISLKCHQSLFNLLNRFTNWELLNLDDKLPPLKAVGRRNVFDLLSSTFYAERVVYNFLKSFTFFNFHHGSSWNELVETSEDFEVHFEVFKSWNFNFELLQKEDWNFSNHSKLANATLCPLSTVFACEQLCKAHFKNSGNVQEKWWPTGAGVVQLVDISLESRFWTSSEQLLPSMFLEENLLVGNASLATGQVHALHNLPTLPVNHMKMFRHEALLIMRCDAHFCFPQVVGQNVDTKWSQWRA